MSRMGSGALGEVDAVDIGPRRPGLPREAAAIGQEQGPGLGDRRPAVDGAPLLAVHGEVVHRRLLPEAGVAGLEILVEEAQHLGQHAEPGLHALAPRRDIDPGAVVPRSQQEMAMPAGERQEADDRAVGEAGSVHPPGDRVDRQVLADRLGVAAGAERLGAEARIVGQAVVTETELGDEIRHAEVAAMLGDRGAAEGPVGVVVDRLRPGEGRVAEVGELAQEVAAVVVERDHQLVVVPGELVHEHATRIVVVAPRVPDREQRRDRLDRRMAGRREKGGRRPDVGDARRPDLPVRPWLADDPVRDLAAVLALRWRSEALAGAEAGAGSAHVDDDQRVAARDQEVAKPTGPGARLDGAVGQADREAPIVGREKQDRRPAVGSRAGAVRKAPVSSPRPFERRIQISRTPLSCRLRAKSYATYRAGRAFRHGPGIAPGSH